MVTRGGSGNAVRQDITTQYEFVNGFRAPRIPATDVYARIDRLQRANGGIVTPDMVINDAKPANSPLHDYFEWDDATAGHAYRKWQARNLLHSIRLVTIQDGVKTSEHRVILSVPKTDESERGYMIAETAMGNPLWRAALLEQAARDLASWRARYQDLAELADLFPVIDEFIASHTPEPKPRKKKKAKAKLAGVPRT